jgi:hypothetical protein
MMKEGSKNWCREQLRKVRAALKLETNPVRKLALREAQQKLQRRMVPRNLEELLTQSEPEIETSSKTKAQLDSPELKFLMAVVEAAEKAYETPTGLDCRAFLEQYKNDHPELERDHSGFCHEWEQRHCKTIPDPLLKALLPEPVILSGPPVDAAEIPEHPRKLRAGLPTDRRIQIEYGIVTPTEDDYE